jgi:hypothetical protein
MGTVEHTYNSIMSVTKADNKAHTFCCKLSCFGAVLVSYRDAACILSTLLHFQVDSKPDSHNG